MIRYFSVIVVSFGFLVALGVAQDKTPAPKKKVVVPEVQKMQAMSSGALRSGNSSARWPFDIAAKHWSGGSAMPCADHAPNLTRGALHSPTSASQSMSS